jgi:hypothetical protein
MSSKGRSGQAMIIAVLSLGGAILGATTLAGLLLLYNIRSTTDSINSAKAIFAADAGVNWALYSYYQHPVPPVPQPTFGNGATVSVTCYDASDVATPSCDDNINTPDKAEYAISEGVSLDSRRTFYLGISAATTTVP